MSVDIDRICQDLTSHRAVGLCLSERQVILNHIFLNTVKQKV